MYPELQNRAWLVEHYVTRQLPPREIATIVGCTKAGIHSALRRHEIASARSGRRPSHGHCVDGKSNGTPTYRSWKAMWNRCTNPTYKSWKHYGGRGIRVCDEWKSFGQFLEDMGERPAGKTIDRIDNDGNYEPENCRWSTAKEQQANKQGESR